MKRSAIVKSLAASVTAVVLVSLVAAFWMLGSPAEQRQYRLDQRRISDLAGIVNSISVYAGTHDALPTDLSVFSKESGLPQAPADPLSGVPYDYVVLGPQTYRICATFATSSNAAMPDYLDSQGWTHLAGRQCFERKQKIGKDQPGVEKRPGGASHG